MLPPWEGRAPRHVLAHLTGSLEAGPIDAATRWFVSGLCCQLHACHCDCEIDSARNSGAGCVLTCVLPLCLGSRSRLLTASSEAGTGKTHFEVFSFASDRELLRSRAGTGTRAVGPRRADRAPRPGAPCRRGIAHCISASSVLRPSLPSAGSPSLATRSLICVEKDEWAPQWRRCAWGRLPTWSAVCGVSYSCHQWGRMAGAPFCAVHM